MARRTTATNPNASRTRTESPDSDLTAIPSATGRIQRLYFSSTGCYIRLTPNPSPSPLDGYFLLRLAHPNFSALVSLLLLAVSQGYPILLRTDAEITPTKTAVVRYAVIDF